MFSVPIGRELGNELGCEEVAETGKDDSLKNESSSLSFCVRPGTDIGCEGTVEEGEEVASESTANGGNSAIEEV